MKSFLIPFIALLVIPFQAGSEHLKDKKKLVITTQSAKESISLAKHLTKKGIVKYSAYWCPNCLFQGELFGKEAYNELIIVECARDGINSQTQLCIDKNITGFPSWEINGKIILGVQSLQDLAKESNFKGI